jgi:hypothetical protein
MLIFFMLVGPLMGFVRQAGNKKKGPSLVFAPVLLYRRCEPVANAPIVIGNVMH